MTYRDRYSKLIEKLDQLIEHPVSLEMLCAEVGVSRFHFQRQFSALFDLSATQLVRLLRLKKATFALAYRTDTKVIDIAYDVGFESPEAFSRAFKTQLGMSPSEFRQSPNWNVWQPFDNTLNAIRENAMTTQMKNTENSEPTIELVDFEPLKIHLMVHSGSPKLLGNTLKQFIEWRKQNKLSPKTNRTFNLVYCDPNTTPEEDFRFGLAVETNQNYTEEFVEPAVIPGGLCARIRHQGPDVLMGEKIEYLYRQWLESNDYKLRDFPMFFERVSFFPDVPESQMVTDIYLPLER